MVDGDRIEATEFRVDDSHFMRFYLGNPTTLVTVVAPTEIVGSGFTAEIGEPTLA